jgi:DNA-3-methyladenine glycosylase I
VLAVSHGRWLSGQMSGSQVNRCPWCPPDDPVYIAYHDIEWGVPERDGRRLFEMLNLEGAQAGLSWRTVLGKRARYREVFENFDPERLAKWPDARIEAALKDSGIIRNRLKVNGVVRNARAVMEEFDGDLRAFSKYIWDLAGDKTVVNRFWQMSDVPARTPVSDAMSKDLKRRGFTFVGSTICYAFMQAVGMVNDHTVGCFRYRQVGRRL